MNVIKAFDYKDVCEMASDIFIERIKERPNVVLGLATGSTPLGVYELLIKAYKKKELDFSKVTTFNLDEYCGLNGENTQSYRYYMERKFFSHVNINPSNVYLPNGEKSEAECLDYEKLLRKKVE